MSSWGCLIVGLFAAAWSAILLYLGAVGWAMLSTARHPNEEDDGA